MITLRHHGHPRRARALPGRAALPRRAVLLLGAALVLTAALPAAALAAPVTTSTALSADPANPVTNRVVVLTATVSPASPVPAGTVTFENGTTPLSGCSSVPVTFNGSVYTATCQASFEASTSPESITATFTPNDSSAETASSATLPLTVGRDSTATALQASNMTPTTGTPVTYTAVITPVHTGPAEPAGSVRFLDGTVPVTSCSARAVTPGSPSSTASCTVTYTGTKAHTISAAYSGNGNFAGSTSSAVTVTPVAAPAPPTAPVAKARPLITGSTVSGDLLTVSTGTWKTASSLRYAYQWDRCMKLCSPIQGARHPSYRLTAADIGARMRVTVTATNSVGSTNANAKAVGPVLATADQIKALLLAEIAPHGKGSRIRRMLHNDGYLLTFRALEPGTASITWYRVRKGHRPLKVATGQVTYGVANTSSIKIRLTRRGRRLLRHSDRLKLLAKGSFTPTGQPAVTARRKFKIRH